MITVTAYDATRSQRMTSGANSGLIGLAVMATVDAVSDNTKNQWRYSPASLDLEPVAEKVASQ